MTQKSVLIAAISGRALAQSAREAGYAPLVVDSFTDIDTLECAHKAIRLKSAFSTGFHIKSLTTALNDLAAAADTAPIGLVLGTGFEDQPTLIKELAKTFTILGNDADTIAKVKDPAQIFPILRERGIRYPQTSVTPPDDPSGWLKKRVGGTGGVHIRICPDGKNQPNEPGYYYQRKQDGLPISVAGVVSQRGFAIGLCQQWLAPTPNHPYRFGGIATPPQLDPDTEARLIDTTVELTRAFGLKGFISIDFLVTDDDAMLLEINPRPTAALEILDSEHGHMFAAHLTAVAGGDPTHVLTANSAQTTAERASAIGYLYNDSTEIEIPTLTWPQWAHDRAAPGTKIKRGQPLASVSADATTADDAQNLCRKRLGELSRLLYGPAKTETSNARDE